MEKSARQTVFFSLQIDLVPNELYALSLVLHFMCFITFNSDLEFQLIVLNNMTI